VLDWREMTGRYPGARIKLLSGGDHALSDFDDHLDEAFRLSGPALRGLPDCWDNPGHACIV
jgi:predicted esterase YcpF (UPF0227 family)